MADIRINSLPSTATSFNTDDYIAIDGASAGTRKMLAATLPLTDVTFGSSGPSAKSSIAARAARQGLVFDGTARASGVLASTVGTDWTVKIKFKLPTGFFTADSGVISVGPAGGAAFAAQGIYLVGDTATLALYLVSTSGSNYRYASFSKASLAEYEGKIVEIAISQTGGAVTFYFNGVAKSPTSTGSGGTAPGWDYAFTGTTVSLASNGTGQVWAGTILDANIYNRALSAAEVVALYEAGVPAGADYNNAGTTDIKPSAGTYAYWFGTGSISSATASSFTIAAGASSLAVRNVSGTFSAVSGRRYRATIVASGLNSAADFGSQGFTSSLSAGNVSNGTNVIEFTATSTASGYFAISSISSTAGGSISISSIVALGLLLAPDAGQAGGGLTWYDTSGNAANITLPASGVTWNVPTSGKMSGLLEIKTVNNTYSGGALKITDQLGNSTFITRANGTTYISADGTTDHFLLSSSGAGTFAGNLTVSGGTITSGSGTLTLKSSANTVVLQSAGTTALTLDSSQNATFAGKITANGAGSTFKGTSTNDDAAAGYVGEIITSTVESGSAVSLTSATLANITSISLTAGDWDVSGVVGYSLSGATVQSFLNAMNNASAALGPTGSFTKHLVTLTTITDSALLPTPVYRFTLTSTSTVYLIGRANFTAGTVSGYGHIRARRVR